MKSTRIITAVRTSIVLFGIIGLVAFFVGMTTDRDRANQRAVEAQHAVADALIDVRDAWCNVCLAEDQCHPERIRVSTLNCYYTMSTWPGFTVGYDCKTSQYRDLSVFTGVRPAREVP